MPLPLIPVAIGLASLVAGGYGVKKGLDAKDDLALAKSIGEDAMRRHKKSITALDSAREKTNKHFENLGKLKANIFSIQIKRLVDEVQKKKKSRSKLVDYKESFEKLDLPILEKMVTKNFGVEIELGMASGMVALGSFIAGPAIAVTGFMMASKAEEALTKARAYEADVDEKIAEIEGIQLILQGLQANAKEMTRTLKRLVPFFDETANNLSGDNVSFERLLAVGKALKEVLETPILEKDGSATKNLESKLRTKIQHSGVLEYEG